MKHTLLPLNPKTLLSFYSHYFCSCLFLALWDFHLASTIHYSYFFWMLLLVFYLKSNETIPLRTSTGGCFHFPKFSHVTRIFYWVFFCSLLPNNLTLWLICKGCVSVCMCVYGCEFCVLCKRYEMTYLNNLFNSLLSPKAPKNKRNESFTYSFCVVFFLRKDRQKVNERKGKKKEISRTRRIKKKKKYKKRRQTDRN